MNSLLDGTRGFDTSAVSTEEIDDFRDSAFTLLKNLAHYYHGRGFEQQDITTVARALACAKKLPSNVEYKDERR
jgi:hypothetical protein